MATWDRGAGMAPPHRRASSHVPAPPFQVTVAAVADHGAPAALSTMAAITPNGRRAIALMGTILLKSFLDVLPWRLCGVRSMTGAGHTGGRCRTTSEEPRIGAVIPGLREPSALRFDRKSCH